MKRIIISGFFMLIALNSISQEWKKLNTELINLYRKGEYEKATLIGEKALIAAEKEFGKNSKNYALGLYNLASVHKNIGNYTKAEPLYMEAMNIRKKVLGEEHPDYATSLNNLAVFYDNMGNFAKAEPLYVEGLNTFKKVWGGKHPDYITSLNNLASLYKRMGNYDKAEPLHIEAMNVRKKVLGGEHPDYATSIDNLASLYSSMGQYAKAEPLYIQAKEIRKKNLGEDHPGYAESLNNLASLYEKMGQFSKAELLYIQSKETWKASLRETSSTYAAVINNLAGLYTKIGNYKKAEPLLIEARNIWEKTLGKNHLNYGICLNNLAVFYKLNGNYAKAEPLYIQASEIYKAALGDDHPDYAISLINLASLYSGMGQYAKAEPLSIKANEIRKKFLGEDHPGYAESLNNLGALYYDMGQYAKAEPFFIQAKDIRKNSLGEKHIDFFISLNNLGALYEMAGNIVKAESSLVISNKLMLQGLLEIFSVLSEEEKELLMNKNNWYNEDLLSFLYKYSTLSDSSKIFILDQQLQLKSLILADTKSLLQALQSSKDSTLQKLYRNWISIKKRLSQQFSLPITKRSNELNNWEKQAEDLEKQLATQSSAFRQEQQSLRIKSSEVQKRLKFGEAAVEFVWFRLHNKKWTDSTIYGAFILNEKDPFPVFVPLFEEKQLQKLFDSAGNTATSMVSKFYRGAELKNNSAATALGKELYNLVWAPLEPHLKGIKKISYSPAGKLYGIAFHALPVDSTRILMDKYELNQYISTRQVALRDQNAKTGKPQSATLFGDAAFTLDSAAIARLKGNNQLGSNIYSPPNRGNRGGSWASLPGTAEEVKKVKQLFEQNSISTKTFTQTTATEENLKALSGNSPQVLHIATHGFFLPEPDRKRKESELNNENAYVLADDPLLRSGLILSGGNYAWSGKTPIEGAEDGIATAYEISQLNLSNTELVVLSACETALGDVKGSEGVFGLQRAFKMAGVKKMIVSLWQVPDKETAELMTAFYTYWIQGNSINQAFSKAQAGMRKKYSPFYWAAFVLVE